MNQEVQDTVNQTIWQLAHIAKALTRAKQLEKMRSNFHKELYDCIAYPSMAMDPLNPMGMSTATDAQAIRIIEAKERYDKLIQQEYSRYVRWKNFLALTDTKDSLILIRYFQKKKSVEPEIIYSLLQRINHRVEIEEELIEKERDGKAMSEYQRVRRMLHRKELPKQTIQFFDNGYWNLVDLNEYEQQQRKKNFEKQIAHKGYVKLQYDKDGSVIPRHLVTDLLTSHCY